MIMYIKLEVFPKKKTRRPFLMDKLDGIEGPRALIQVVIQIAL